MRIQFALGEFRNKKDECSLTKKEHMQNLDRSKKMHSNINYASVIAELEHKVKQAKPKDKANYLAVLQIAKQQQSAGYGNI